MIKKLLQFELKFHSKQISFIVLSILFTAYGFLAINQGFKYLEFSSKYNDAFNLNFLSGIVSIVSTFATVFLCINAVLRDKLFNFEGLIFSTGIKKINFFLSRFLGVFLIILLLNTVAMLGVFIGTFINNLDPETLHQFNFTHYFWPWLLLILPNVFVTTAIIFSITLLSKKSIVTYITALVFIALNWICGFYINSPLFGGSSLASKEILDIASLIDPVGLAAFFEQTQFLTPHERNETVLSLSNNFLWNRIIWLSFSIVLLLITYKKYSFRTIQKKVKKQILSKENIKSNTTYKPTKISINSFKSMLINLKSVVKLDAQIILSGIPFKLIMVLWCIILSLVFNYSIASKEIYGSRYPTTDLFIGQAIEVLPILGLFLIVFYSSELIWKSRQHRFSGIIEATPSRNSMFYVSKIVSITIIPIVLILLTIGVSIIFQVTNNFYDFQLQQYFSLFYFAGIQIFLYAVFALFIQTLVANKYLGMIISAIILILFSTSRSVFGLEHPLFFFNKLPSMARSYSDFVGYGQYVSKFSTLALYWLTFSGILIVLSNKFWKRGTSVGFKKIIKTVFSKKEKLQLLSLVLIFVTIGSYAYYNLNVVNEFVTSNERLDFNEQYERKYKQYDHLTVPQLVSLKTNIDIYPDSEKYIVQSNTIIANKTKKPMKSIFVTAPQPLKSINIEGSKQVFHDTDLGTYLFELNSPLLPEESLKMTYNMEKQVKGFETNKTINTNGTYIKNQNFNPILGYVNNYEIEYNYERIQRGLPKKDSVKVNDSYLQLDSKFNFENVKFETLISTSKNQTAISSGSLIKQWQKDDRNYYHYKASDTINSMIAYFSARYTVKKEVYKGIQLELFHHPNHTQNVDEMIRVAKATIDYCSDNFGKYPHDYLRIVETSNHESSNGQAMPGVITINEKIFKRNVENPDSFNVVARVLIHEISHQWWGFLLTPKRVEGYMVLSESLAKYTESVILEKMYGKAMVNKLSASTISKYFSGRSYASEIEPALYLSNHQAYLGYSKGAIIMSATKELISEKKLNNVLKKLVNTYKNKPIATTLNLIEELYKVTPKEHHKLLNDWMKHVVTYDLKVVNAVYKKMLDGKFELTLTVNSKRFETNSLGEEIEINIDETIQIGVFKKHPNALDSEKDIIYLKPHQINNNEIKIKIITDFEPIYVGIDPNNTRLDKNLEDNLISSQQIN